MASKAEVELHIEHLLNKHRAWLMQQPEWPILMGATDRATRRRVREAIAADLTTIPVADLAEDTVSRGMRRRILKELERRAKYWEGLT